MTCLVTAFVKDIIFDCETAVILTMKKVSQSYFDETVKSNMELFDLSVDDAIAESVQTFALEVWNDILMVYDM